MVQATVDNDVVSISLGGGETTTVPNGETWRVTLSFGPSTSNREADVEINGEAVGYSYSDDGNGTGTAMIVTETVLTSGDSVSTSSNTQGHIGGFVVS